MWNEGGFGFTTPNKTMDTPDAKKGRGERSEQRVFPVCIRQIRDCPSDDFVLFGSKATFLTLVCILRELDVTSTKVTYTLEDHTGQMQAVLWLDTETDTSLPSVREGRYVQVTGSLRTTDGVKNLLVLKMVPVEDVNIVTTHLLEVIHLRGLMEELSNGKPSASLVKKNLRNDLSNSVIANDDGGDKGAGNLTAVQDKVYNIIKNCTSQTGKSRESIIDMFPSYQKLQVSSAIDYLLQEGFIYNSIDSSTFLAT